MRTTLVDARSSTASLSGADAGAVRPPWRDFFALLRLAAFRPVQPAGITGRESAILLVGALLFAAWIAIEPLVHSREMVFSWYGLPHLGFMIAGMLALTWVLSRWSRPYPGYRRTLFVTLGALPLVMVGAVGSWKLVYPWVPLLMVALSLYALAYFAYGLRVLTGAWQPRALLAGALTTAAFLGSLDYLQVNPRVWARAEEKADRLNVAGVDWVRMARVQFAQQARIEAAVAAMAPQTPGVVDTFFVGFAGYGEEPVFSREIGLAAEVVGARFGSANRSLRLVNDRRDVEAWPLATEPGLRYALRRVGAVMGREDVLFLAFSSHGDRGKGLRVSNPGLVPGKLSPATLDEMLREADIPWRVVVVSACYSGTFIDRLADERSIVITAASQDRKSFGCNDSRELTYFGEAFFRDALPGAPSLRAAFESARGVLERKERTADITPSLPRASFGAALEARLRESPPAALARQGR